MAAVLIFPPLIGETYEAGDKLYAYETGTSTPVTVYQNDDLTTAHSTPVVADATGRFDPIYVNETVGDIKITVTDSNDVVRYTIDPFIVSDLSSLTASVSSLNTSVTSIDGRLTTAESEIDTLQTESADYESRITSLEGQTAPLLESDFTGANQSLSTNGYQELPGGLIIQWGKTGTLASSSSTGTDITLPKAFTTTFFSVVANEATQGFPGNASNWGGCPAIIKSLSQFTIYPQRGISGTYHWMAFGY